MTDGPDKKPGHPLMSEDDRNSFDEDARLWQGWKQDQIPQQTFQLDGFAESHAEPDLMALACWVDGCDDGTGSDAMEAMLASNPELLEDVLAVRSLQSAESGQDVPDFSGAALVERTRPLMADPSGAAKHSPRTKSRHWLKILTGGLLPSHSPLRLAAGAAFMALVSGTSAGAYALGTETWTASEESEQVWESHLPLVPGTGWDDTQAGVFTDVD